jgi:hypothetical protein
LALADIRERGIAGDNGTSGMTFADIRIWNEHVPLGDRLAPIPESEAGAMLLAGMIVIVMKLRRTVRARRS